MAEKLIKKYPLNFSKDITDIVNILSLKNGEEAQLYGSARFKLNYPSDYDMFQMNQYKDGILKEIQDVIKKMMKTKDLFIGDIKSGMIEEMKVIDDDIDENNYNSKIPKMKMKLKTLLKNKNISDEEYDASLKLLKPDLKEFDISIIRHEIRFEVIRWKPQDILNGFVNYRNKKIDFYDYLISDSVTKIDAIAWVNGIRFTEITMVYILMKGEEFLNRGFQDLEKILIDTIPFLLFKGKYSKILKRINAIELTKSEREIDKLLIRRVYKFSNSDLGRLNQIVSDISVLQYLIENIKNIPKSKFIYEIDQMKYRLGNITVKKYIKDKNQDAVNKLIDILEKDVVDLQKLDELYHILFNILQEESLKYMKRIKLYPVPEKYLPKPNKRGRGKNDVIIKKKDFIKEHKKLIPILKKGSRAEQINEANDQQSELKTIVSGGKLKVKYIKEFLNQSYEKDRKETIDDFTLDKTLSTNNVAVYHNKKTGQTVISHKGTQGITDWGNNIVYGLLGKTGYKYTSRFKDAEKIQRATEAKYGKQNITTIGHSQGALLGELLGKEGKETITLNKATRIGSNEKGKTQYDISSTGDIVSSLNPLSKQTKRDVIIKKQTYNPLTEHGIDILNRLDEDIEIGEGRRRKRK